MSPQYEDFYQAAVDTTNQRTEKKPKIELDEMHDKISLGSLSQALIGLSKQALSFRKEAHGIDYLHKFYEKQCHRGEITEIDDPDYDKPNLHEPTNVGMERDYLKAWAIFDKEVDKIKPRLLEAIR